MIIRRLGSVSNSNDSSATRMLTDRDCEPEDVLAYLKNIGSYLREDNNRLKTRYRDTRLSDRIIVFRFGE